MRLTFGDCVFDSGTREVLRSGRPTPISPKAFRLLEILIERRPNAVSKDDLHQILWPNTYVSDANLPNLVAELRTALDDQTRSSRLIRTVQRFGYAFCAEAPPRGAAQPAAVYRLIWGDREIALRSGENLFGRDEDSIIWIDDALVSRRHARILIDESGAFLEDLGSKNGSFLCGKRIEARTQLADRDLLTIGPASMTFRVFQQTEATASATEK
jgi:FHA domain-containing protein